MQTSTKEYFSLGHARNITWTTDYQRDWDKHQYIFASQKWQNLLYGFLQFARPKYRQWRGRCSGRIVGEKNLRAWSTLFPYAHPRSLSRSVLTIWAKWGYWRLCSSVSRAPVHPLGYPVINRISFYCFIFFYPPFLPSFTSPQRQRIGWREEGCNNILWRHRNCGEMAGIAASSFASQVPYIFGAFHVMCRLDDIGCTEDRSPC